MLLGWGLFNLQKMEADFSQCLKTYLVVSSYLIGFEMSYTLRRGIYITKVWRRNIDNKGKKGKDF